MRLVRSTVVTVIGVMLTAGGCSFQNKSKLDAEARKNIAVSQDQLRLRMRSLVDPMCGRVMQAADAIIAGTTDRDVQMAALTWKIDAVPALRQTLYEPEPLIASVDTLVLCMQMTNYFETGAGKQLLGAASAQAAETCRQMTQDFENEIIAMTVNHKIERARAYAEKWAADHPIRHSISEREQMQIRGTGDTALEGLTAGEAIAEVTTTMDDLNRKVDVYSWQLFRQARWEVERLKLQMDAELRLDQAVPLAERATKSAESAVATVDRLAPAVERSLAVAETTPKLIASERETVLNAVHTELIGVMKFAHEERVEAFEQLGKERGAALAELHETIAEQRKLVISDANGITSMQIDYAVRQVTRVIAVALAAAIVMVVIGLYFARRMLTRRAV